MGMIVTDFDRLLADHAVKNGICSPEQVNECLRIQEKLADEGKVYYLGQVLIKQRYISCTAFLDLENELNRKLYECENCSERYSLKELGQEGTLTCRGCNEEVGIEAGLDSLTEVEILASKDPDDLAVLLKSRERRAPPPGGAGTAPAGEAETAPGNGAEAGKSSKTRRASKSSRTRPSRSSRSKAPYRKPQTRAEREKEKDRIAAEARDQLSDLSRYEIIDELGRGGMGVVFKARHQDLDRIVGLKVVKTGPHVTEKQLLRFVREGRAAARLNHPGIIRVFDIGTHRDLFYLAMEYVDGRSLHQVLREEGVTRRRALELMDQIIDAIGFAHQHEIVHRDLKPQNIVIDEAVDGRARLIDFGLAKSNSDRDANNLTQAGQVIGTVFYLSPEQVRGESREADARADIFATGVIFYEMISGARPFDGKSAAEVYSKILRTEPAPPSDHQPSIDPDLDALVLRALEKNADDRYQTAEEFREALHEYLRTHEMPEIGPPNRETDTVAGTATSPIPRETAASTHMSGAGRPAAPTGSARFNGRGSRASSADRAAGTSPTTGSGKHGLLTASGKHSVSSSRLHANARGGPAVLGARPRVGGGRSSGAPAAVIAAGVVGVIAILAVAALGRGTGPGVPVGGDTGAATGGGIVDTDTGSGSGGGPIGPDVGPIRPPDKSPADSALAKARTYATDNPTEYAEIHFRFSEVVRRFDGAQSPALDEARAEIAALEQRVEREFEEETKTIEAALGEGRFAEALAKLEGAKERFDGLGRDDAIATLSGKVEAAAEDRLRAVMSAFAKAKAERDAGAAEKALEPLIGTGLTSHQKALSELALELSALKARWKGEADEAIRKQRERVSAERTKIAEALVARRYGDAGEAARKVVADPKLMEIKDELAVDAEAVALLESFWTRMLANARRDLEGQQLSIKGMAGRVTEVRADGSVVVTIQGGAKAVGSLSKPDEIPGKGLLLAYGLTPAALPIDASLERAAFCVTEGIDVASDDHDLIEATSDATAEGTPPARLIERLRELVARVPREDDGGDDGGGGEDGGDATTTGGGAAADPEKPPRATNQKKLALKQATEMILIPAGDFTMGISVAGPGDEQPSREVGLRPYLIGRYEVTNGVYKKFLSKLRGRPHSKRFCHPQEPKDKVDHIPAYWDNERWNGDAQPVIGVDWWDAFACARAFGCRLPTEAEWERAARGDQELTYPWGQAWNPRAVVSIDYWIGREATTTTDMSDFRDLMEKHKSDRKGFSVAVNEVPEGRSPVGAFHMAGNVTEWVSDWYGEDYYEERWRATALNPPDKNPPGPTTGTMRVARGGSWYSGFDTARPIRPASVLRTTFRFAYPADQRGFDRGFRLAKDP